MHLRTSQEFEVFAEKARQEGLLAIDTEFLSGKTYHAKLCLLQVAAGDQAAIIDPLEVEDLSILADLLLDENILKILHAGSQDMELLARVCGRPPVPVFDTQVAAALAGFPAQIGYARLVADLLNVTLDKSETFTDWSRRPLTQKQAQYALNDVHHLVPMYLALKMRLERDGRLGWLKEDFEAMSVPGAYTSVPEEQFRRVKRATTLNGRQLAVLREVAAWRETEAQRRDLPRQWIIKDDSLIEIARRRPQKMEALADIRDLNPRSLGSRAEELLSVVKKGMEVPSSEFPILSKRPHLLADMEGVVKLMGALVRMKSDTHGIAVPSLASQGELERLASGEIDDSPLLQGWKKEIIGKDLMKLLSGEIILRVQEGSVIVEPYATKYQSSIDNSVRKV